MKYFAWWIRLTVISIKFMSTLTNTSLQSISNVASPPVQSSCEQCHTTCYLQLKNTPVSQPDVHSPVLLLAAPSIEPAGPHRTVTAVDNCTLLLWATAGTVTTLKLWHLHFLKGRNCSFVSDWLITACSKHQQLNLNETFIVGIIRRYLIGWCCRMVVSNDMIMWKMK